MPDIDWQPGDMPPDDETDVLIVMASDAIWVGWHEDGKWYRYAGHSEMTQTPVDVVWWAHLPEPPS